MESDCTQIAQSQGSATPSDTKGEDTLGGKSKGMTSVKLCLCLLVINTLGDDRLPTQFPLSYVNGLEPSLLRLLQTPTSTLRLFLTDSPILKHSSVQRKLELQVSRFVLDLSDLAKVSHNLKRSVSFLKNTRIKVSSEFKSAHSGAL